LDIHQGLDDWRPILGDNVGHPSDVGPLVDVGPHRWVKETGTNVGPSRRLHREPGGPGKTLSGQPPGGGDSWNIRKGPNVGTISATARTKDPGQRLELQAELAAEEKGIPGGGALSRSVPTLVGSTTLTQSTEGRNPGGGTPVDQHRRAPAPAPTFDSASPERRAGRPSALTGQRGTGILGAEYRRISTGELAPTFDSASPGRQAERAICADLAGKGHNPWGRSADRLAPTLALSRRTRRG
jgi:hypothetical protein